MSLTRTPMLQVRTPEGIAFPLHLADPITRFAAWFVDRLVVLALSQVAAGVAVWFGFLSQDIAGAMAAVAYFATALGYPILLEWRWRGQTVGKRCFRLRVVDEAGLRLRFSQVVLRNLLRAVDVLPVCYLVGGVATLLTPRAQRLGDLAANTVVIHHARTRLPDVNRVAVPAHNSLRDHPHLVARLRRNASVDEAGIAVQALLRRDSLDPEARVTLYADLAEHFRAKAAFPDTVHEALSDEQFLRNVVDVLFREHPVHHRQPPSRAR